jgi:diguanylate cyclase (GGDEF)-like protein
MSAEMDQAHARAISSERRALDAEKRCNVYRQAFLEVLHENFNNLDDTLNRLLQVLSVTLDVDQVGFWVFDTEHEAIRCTHLYQRASSADPSPTLLKQAEYPRYFAAIERQLVIDAHNAITDPRTAELEKTYLQPLGITSMLDVPVRAFGRFIGILCHEHRHGPRQWTTEDQNFASAVATQVALAHERDHVRRAQSNLLDRSLYDGDTRLPNGVHLESTLLERSQDADENVAVLLAEVDQYNFAVGVLGQQHVSGLLRAIAERLTAAAPSSAWVARTAPHEFAMLLIDVSREQLRDAVNSWQSALQQPLMLGEQPLFATLSIGYSRSDAPWDTQPEHLIGEARLALLDAKHAGGDRAQAFAAPMRERLRQRASVEQELRRGLDAREFDLHFQPVIDLAQGRCISVEALLRWQHPQRGLLTPQEFMQVGIESGVMLELGRRVLRAACEGIATIRRQTGLDSLSVSVNMCAPEVLLPGTAEAAHAELARANLPASALTIEITETVLMVDLERANNILRFIKEGGIRIGLDDFGTAFSSLSWLRWLPIDVVKIDRSFVTGLPTDNRNAAIIRAIVELSRSFNQQVIAEGIETPQQLTALRDLGVMLGQGYLFARPEPAETFSRTWLSQACLPTNDSLHSVLKT